MKSTSKVKPAQLTIEKNWDGRLIARFAENITETESDGIVEYNYDEYVYEDDWSDKLARRIRDRKNEYLEKAKEMEE